MIKVELTSDRLWILDRRHGGILFYLLVEPVGCTGFAFGKPVILTEGIHDYTVLSYRRDYNLRWEVHAQGVKQENGEQSHYIISNHQIKSDILFSFTTKIYGANHSYRSRDNFHIYRWDSANKVVKSENTGGLRNDLLFFVHKNNSSNNNAFKYISWRGSFDKIDLRGKITERIDKAIRPSGPSERYYLFDSSKSLFLLVFWNSSDTRSKVSEVLKFNSEIYYPGIQMLGDQCMVEFLQHDNCFSIRNFWFRPDGTLDKYDDARSSGVGKATCLFSEPQFNGNFLRGVVDGCVYGYNESREEWGNFFLRSIYWSI